MKKLFLSITYIFSLFLLVLFSVLFFAFPKNDYSPLENRYLQKAPLLNKDTLMSNAFTHDYDEYITDHFPFRDKFILLNGYIDKFLGRTEKNDVIIGKNSWLYEACEFINTDNVDRNVKALLDFSEKSKIDCSIMLVPFTSLIYSENLPRFYVEADHYNYIKAGLDKHNFLNFIDIFPIFKNSAKNEILYFRTDHHWNAYGSSLAYRELCRHWGLVPAEAPVLKTIKGFLGSHFAKTTRADIIDENFTFWDVENVKLSIDDKVMPYLHDPEKLAQRDKYSALLYGNHPISMLTNDRAKGTILVVKDSFANALMPLLAENYGRIILVDLRYYKDNLLDLCNEYKPEHLLFLYGERSILQDKSIYLRIDEMVKSED